MLRELGCRLSLPPEAGEPHRKSAKGFLQRLRLSAWGREKHGGLPRFWLRWFETANKSKTNINRLCGGCLVGLESRDSFQVQDIVALGMALSNPKGLEDEIWKQLGFFTGKLQLGFTYDQREVYELSTKYWLPLESVPSKYSCDFPPLSVSVGTWGCSNLAFMKARDNR